MKSTTSPQLAIAASASVLAMAALALFSGQVAAPSHGTTGGLPTVEARAAPLPLAQQLLPTAR